MDDYRYESDSDYVYDSSISSPYNEFQKYRHVVPFIVVALSVVGLLGNLFLMYAILAHKHMRTTPNVLIFTLAVGDLLYILVPTPIYVEHELNGSFNFGQGFCKFKAYLSLVGQYASVFSLAALSRDRYIAIVHGMDSRRSGASGGPSCCVFNSYFVVAVIALLSLLLPTPTLHYAELLGGGGGTGINGTENGVRNCRSTPSPLTEAIVYESLRAVTGYVIPLMLTSFYYINIAMSLFKSTHSFQSEYQSAAMAHQARVRKRLALSVLVISFFFFVCWFPYFFYNIWMLCLPLEDLLNPEVSVGDHVRYASILLPVVNTCLDPWLLFAISSKHRESLLSSCRKGKRKGKQHSVTMMGSDRSTFGGKHSSLPSIRATSGFIKLSSVQSKVASP